MKTKGTSKLRILFRLAAFGTQQIQKAEKQQFIQFFLEKRRESAYNTIAFQKHEKTRAMQ